VTVRPLVLAHRGASRAAPENTLAAFALARAMGADGVELDVRSTRDGVLVVHHDPVRAGFGLLADEPFAALRAAHPDVPTLAEALAGCVGLLVNVEIKCLPWEPDRDDPDARPVVRAVVAALGDAPVDVDVIVSSFDLGAVDACRALAPGLTTAWLTSGRDVAASAAIAAEHGHRWLHPDRDAALAGAGAGVAAAHGRGVLVDVWTVDDPAEMAALAAAGYDAIVTNVPDVARHTYESLFSGGSA
jgi:glycerophosphoryl diester phosphodiesterase